MHTSTNLTARARKFRREVKAELADRELTVTDLCALLPKRRRGSREIHPSRNAVSRAINRGEFPLVQQLIKEALEI